jgi:hypothetical protein
MMTASRTGRIVSIVTAFAMLYIGLIFCLSWWMRGGMWCSPSPAQPSP